MHNSKQNEVKKLINLNRNYACNLQHAYIMLNMPSNNYYCYYKQYNLNAFLPTQTVIKSIKIENEPFSKIKEYQRMFS